MFFKLKVKKKKRKWFKEYKKILHTCKEYYCKELKHIYGFDSKLELYNMCFYDLTNNDELNRFIKKLYKLNKNKNYEVDISYRKKDFKNINYIRPEFDSTGHGGLAKIKFMNNDLISSVEITWTQINNDEAIIGYNCNFKKIITKFIDIHNFVEKNYKRLKMLKYSTFYYQLDFFENDENENIRVELDYFRILIQSYIEDIAYSHYIKKYKSPIKNTYLLDKKTNKILKYIKDPFLSESYIFDDDQYLIFNYIEDCEGTEIDEFIFKKQFNPISITTLLSEQRMSLYYLIFYKIERYELEIRITKYLNSKKFLINFFDYKWLINKKRRIDEKRIYEINQKRVQTIKGYSDNNISLPNNDMVDGMKRVYEDNINFIKDMNALNYKYTLRCK